MTVTKVKRAGKRQTEVVAPAVEVAPVEAKKARQKRNNETLVSTRIDREHVELFNAMLAEAQALAAKSKTTWPKTKLTRSAVARAALVHMFATCKTKKDRALWIKDIVAAG